MKIALITLALLVGTFLLGYIIRYAYSASLVRPPYIVDVCIESHNETNVVYGYGYNMMSKKYEYYLHTQTTSVCDKYRQECKWGRDFQGEKSCDGINLNERDSHNGIF